MPVPTKVENIEDMVPPAGYHHAMETVYEDGRLLRDWTLDEIRARSVRGL